MKLKMTLMVITAGKLCDVIDVIAEFPDVGAALTAIAQLGTANSMQSHHPKAQELLEDLPLTALAHIHETFKPGTVVLIKEVVEFQDELPKELKEDPEVIYFTTAFRPREEIPPEGVIRVLHEGHSVH